MADLSGYDWTAPRHTWSPIQAGQFETLVKCVIVMNGNWWKYQIGDLADLSLFRSLVAQLDLTQATVPVNVADSDRMLSLVSRAPWLAAKLERAMQREDNYAPLRFDG